MQWRDIYLLYCVLLCDSVGSQHSSILYLESHFDSVRSSFRSKGKTDVFSDINWGRGGAAHSVFIIFPIYVGMLFFSNSSFSRSSSRKQCMRDCAKPSLGDGSTKTPSQHWPSGSSSCSPRWRQLNNNLMAPCLFKELHNHDNFILLVKTCTLLGDKATTMATPRNTIRLSFQIYMLSRQRGLFLEVIGRCCCVEVAVKCVEVVVNISHLVLNFKIRYPLYSVICALA